MVQSVERSVWWIKRDFRVSDNHCLYLSTESSKEVIPFFCWEPGILGGEDYGSFHLQAQWQALGGLSASLKKRGSGIVERMGEVVEALDRLHREHPFQRLHSYQETGNDLTFRRDREVRAWCRAHGVEWVESVGSTVVRGLSAEQKREASRKGPRGRLAVLPVPGNLRPPADLTLFSTPMSWEDLLARFPRFSGPPRKALQTVNERAAWDTLSTFLQERGVAYSGGISSPNSAFTAGSRLSPHLAWGTISSGAVFHALDQRRVEVNSEKGPNPWRRSLRAFESRLHWRDHFIQRLEGSPDMEFSAINPAYDSIKYGNDAELLAAWTHGKTGYPMVDACMRCLRETGFINFRMRAMVVSFACFGLHLSWRFIHGPLARMFLDYEPGIHISQLQMQAGITGINAIRVYSPTKQFLDHDPDGLFVKQWIPELREHTPVEIAHSAEVNISGYLPPVVSLKSRTKEMKEQIFEIRKSMFGKESSRKILQKHGSRKGTSRKKREKKEAVGQLALFKDSNL
ncbi:MAG: FAD-binding domain-containing protein [Opitutales bacterium]|nr:FAD-binding domain-containing protein [Opitutales bacterium]